MGDPRPAADARSEKRGTHTVTWIDREREARCPPNPDFPAGKDLDVSEGAPQACKVDLPYPAKRCGIYMIECAFCGLRVGVTTAGRPDDPRSVTMPCKEMTRQ